MDYQAKVDSTFSIIDEGILNCSTTVSGPDPNVPCIFPFKFNGVTYHQCTTAGITNGDTTPWCSTQVDDFGVFAGGGNWGNCGSECQIASPGK